MRLLKIDARVIKTASRARLAFAAAARMRSAPIPSRAAAHAERSIRGRSDALSPFRSLERVQKAPHRRENNAGMDRVLARRSSGLLTSG